MIPTKPIAQDGFTIARGVLPSETLAALIESSILPEDGRGGVRNLLDIPAFRELADSPQIRALVEPILGTEAFPVRGILFDKTGEANWKVPWHQDVTIAVTNRIEASGYGPWSIKAGVQHVQPPAQILENMLSVRIHLDDCPASNGALRVISATHQYGKLSQAEIEAVVLQQVPITCEADAGDALLMRPLLIHASSPSTVPSHRRVIHFDFANVELANGLGWRERKTPMLAGLNHA
ncbi:ectoine hydroxylase-related dioxygenase (phytanoyl-CoA dioxygenase family) [Granulicella aggregans]|uniref:Ectoine hydroxylase-related dioxygenase (Phytanoyl-CoA dioxygenase family) n=1 Tax=Granulicella aggregans TaxID=474949 RepID=A0A7W8E3A3_9BACT|nr:phytanoyl-CoA dioxygenase family protein [Granulicella aggregans]MBB5057377.1 ectoine hydroxylase-related dioxygenase (phytanoyl-CoA dioxygenase family) [Granulicella aggregans]